MGFRDDLRALEDRAVALQREVDGQRREIDTLVHQRKDVERACASYRRRSRWRSVLAKIFGRKAPHAERES